VVKHLTRNPESEGSSGAPLQALALPANTRLECKLLTVTNISLLGHVNNYIRKGFTTQSPLQVITIFIYFYHFLSPEAIFFSCMRPFYERAVSDLGP
jgi:hypothetical protein